MKIKRMMAALVAAIVLSSLPALATTTNFTSASSVSFTTTEAASQTYPVSVYITSGSSSGSCTITVSNPAGVESTTTWNPSTNGTATNIYVGAAGAWSIAVSGCTISGSVSYT